MEEEKILSDVESTSDVSEISEVSEVSDTSDEVISMEYKSDLLHLLNYLKNNTNCKTITYNQTIKID